MFSVREFDLQESIDCKISAFLYFDGSNSNITPIKYCGPMLPRITQSSGNVVKFQLFSNGSTSGGGFRIDYLAVRYYLPYLMAATGE